MRSQVIWSCSLLIICCCDKREPPAVELTTRMQSAPGSSVPIAANVTFGGDPSKLVYAWTIQGNCTATPSQTNSSSLTLSIGSDCAGKTLFAKLLVTSPGGSTEKSLQIDVPSPPPPPTVVATASKVCPPCPKSAQPSKAKIDLPKEGDVIHKDKPFMLQGQANKTPGKSIWAVHKRGCFAGEGWPRRVPVNPDESGRFSKDVWDGGGQGCLSVCIYSIDSSNDKKFETWFKVGEAKHDFPAINLQVPGFEELACVQVELQDP